MTIIRGSVGTGLLVGTLLAAGCGKTTRLGHERPDASGGAATGGEGGTSASGGAAGTSGESGAAGDSGAAGGSATGSGAGSGVAGSRSDAGLACRLPKPTPVPSPSPEDLERARLVHEYCATLARDNCWNIGGWSQIYEQTWQCSTEERITACEQDRLYEYVTAIPPTCDDEWQAAITCLAAATHVPCEGAGLPDLPTRFCATEKAALAECQASNPTGTAVTGSRTTCYYGTGEHGPCAVTCSAGENRFTMDCGGPPGLPLACNCFANWADTFVGNFYASDCRDAAQAAADGVWCTNRLDCCIEWPEGGKNVCTCGSNYLGGFLGSCEEYAAGYKGRRVEICPRYQQ